MGAFRDFLLGKPLPAAQKVETRDASGYFREPDVASPDRRMLTRSGLPVSVDEALRVPAVFRSVNILATMISALSIEAIRGGQPLINQPPLVRKPNIDCSRHDFVYDTTMSLALYGEAFWFHPRANVLEVPANVTVLSPPDVDVYLDQTGVIKYRRNTVDGWVDVPALYMSHMKLTRLPGKLRGAGPIQTSWMVIRGALMLEDYVASWWDENEIPEGMLVSDQEVGPDQARMLSAEWTRSRKERRTPVMGRGMRYEVLEIDPSKALYVEASQLKTVQIAQLFGVPAAILDAPTGDAQTYANIQDRNQALRDYTLRSYLDPIESAWGELLPTGTFARFNTDALMRLDDSGRASFYSSAIAAGWLQIPEVRDREGLPPTDSPTDPNGGSDA